VFGAAAHERCIGMAGGFRATKHSSAAFRYCVQKEIWPIIFDALYPEPVAALAFTRVSVGYFRQGVFAAAGQLAGERVPAWRF